jgi:hypothetical protein
MPNWVFVTELRDTIPRVSSVCGGITGNTTLNAAGDRQYANYDLWTIRSQNGTYVSVKTVEFRTDPRSGATMSRAPSPQLSHLRITRRAQYRS